MKDDLHEMRLSKLVWEQPAVSEFSKPKMGLPRRRMFGQALVLLEMVPSRSLMYNLLNFRV